MGVLASSLVRALLIVLLEVLPIISILSVGLDISSASFRIFLDFCFKVFSPQNLKNYTPYLS